MEPDRKPAAFGGPLSEAPGGGGRGRHRHRAPLLQQGEVFRGQPQRRRGHVFREVAGVAGAGDGQHVGALMQRPRQPDLGGRRAMSAGHRPSRGDSVPLPPDWRRSSAIAKNGTNAMPCSAQARSTVSCSRRSRPYLFCTHTTGAIAVASASCATLTSETPRCRISPASRSSAGAPKCSASRAGASGAG